LLTLSLDQNSSLNIITKICHSTELSEEGDHIGGKLHPGEVFDWGSSGGEARCNKETNENTSLPTSHLSQKILILGSALFLPFWFFSLSPVPSQ
jgi:hypothetical protein